MNRARLGIAGVVTASMLIVAPAALATPTVGPISATAGTALPSSTVIATFTQGIVTPPLCAAASSFTATVGWGDGSPTGSAVVSGPTTGGVTCSYDVTAGHLYTAFGPYTVTVDVSATVASPGTGTGPATVADVPPTAGAPLTFAATAGTAASGAVADFSDGNTYAGASTFTASIDWGDGSASSTGTVTALATPGQFEVDGTHTYAAAGTPATSVTVQDAAGATITVPGSADVASNGTTTTGTGTTTTGTTTTTTGTTTTGTTTTSTTSTKPTPATLDVVGTVPVSATAGTQFDNLLTVFTDSEGGTSASSYLVTIQWGDGAATAGTVVSSSMTAGEFGVTGGHLYAAAGSYPIVISVLAPNGSTLQLSTTATVTALPVTTFTLNLAHAALKHSRDLTVTVTCPRSETTCRGYLTAYQLVGSRQVMLGSTLFILPGGRSGVLDLMLPRTRMRQLAHGRKVRLKLVARASDPSTQRNGLATKTFRTTLSG